MISINTSLCCLFFFVYSLNHILISSCLRLLSEGFSLRVKLAAEFLGMKLYEGNSFIFYAGYFQSERQYSEKKEGDYSGYCESVISTLFS